MKAFPVVSVLAAGLIAAIPTFAQHLPVDVEAMPQAKMVVTVNRNGAPAPAAVSRNDVLVFQNKQRRQVISWLPLKGDNAGLQLVILLDDSAPSHLALQFPSLRKFILGLPSSTEIAVGYMQNGRAVMQQQLTADHAAVAESLRIPSSIPGISASPYFVLSDLLKHWPSKTESIRRAVLMVTNGQDPYYSGFYPEQPYLMAAINAAQKANVLVYSIYFRNSGTAGSGSVQTLYGQSYLLKMARDTGGEFYSLAMSSPVSFDPFLDKFKAALDNQYLLTFDATGSGLQRVQVKTEVPKVKLAAASQVNVGKI